MKVLFNPRDNGACPLCRKTAACALRAAIAGSVSGVRDPHAHGLEIVIYSCPQFSEK